MSTLSIIVFRGSPIDASEYRHTALFLETPGSSPLLLHVVGTSGLFQHEVKQNYDPAESKSFVRQIAVAKIQGQTVDAIESRIMATPVRNADKSWNCQQWVGDTLVRLSNVGWITTAERKAAVDTMAGVITDAVDES